MARPSKKQTVDLSGIDYTKLEGESLQNYLKIVGVQAKITSELSLNDYFKFELYQAYPEFKFRINEDSGEKEKYLFAIRLRSDKPLNVTSIRLKDAMLLNSGIDAANALDRNSKFYLLQKAQFENIKQEV